MAGTSRGELPHIFLSFGKARERANSFLSRIALSAPSLFSSSSAASDMAPSFLDALAGLAKAPSSSSSSSSSTATMETVAKVAAVAGGLAVLWATRAYALHYADSIISLRVTVNDAVPELGITCSLSAA